MPKPEIVKPIAIASPLETGIAIASVPAATIEVPTRDDAPQRPVEVRDESGRRSSRSGSRRAAGTRPRTPTSPEPACSASVITVVPPVNAMPAVSAIRQVA